MNTYTAQGWILLQGNETIGELNRVPPLYERQEADEMIARYDNNPNTKGLPRITKKFVSITVKGADVAQYRKKPVVVNAIQFTGETIDECIVFCRQNNKGSQNRWRYETHDGTITGITLYTLEGDMKVIFGDWIICGTKGELYPCRPHVFEDVYEPVVTNDTNGKGPVCTSNGGVPGSLARKAIGAVKALRNLIAAPWRKR